MSLKPHFSPVFPVQLFPQDSLHSSSQHREREREVKREEGWGEQHHQCLCLLLSYSKGS